MLNLQARSNIDTEKIRQQVIRQSWNPIIWSKVKLGLRRKPHLYANKDDSTGFWFQQGNTLLFWRCLSACLKRESGKLCSTSGLVCSEYALSLLIFSMVMFSALCKRRHFGMHFIDYRKIRIKQIYETFNEFCFQSGDDIFQKEMVGSSLIIDLLGKN